MPSHPVPFLPSLPPPVTFYSTETLHRILLPPLATFLSDLTSAEHLLKLHDILDRYRTPKSYHRVDVREVGSGELPWGDERVVGGGGKKEDGVGTSEDAEVAEKATAFAADTSAPPATFATDGIQAVPVADAEVQWLERARGRPIVLPTEQDVQDYIANRDRPAPRAEVMDVTTVKLAGDNAVKTEQTGTESSDAGKVEGDAKRSPAQPQAADADLTVHIDGSAIRTGDAQDGTAPIVPLPSSDPLSEQSATASATSQPIPAPQQTKAPLSSPPIPPRPPSPPRRRVRELRLDLRTLDAAALFQLEIWRREVMGLEKMDMEHPDSIWFHEPTPEPEPEPEPSPEPARKKPRGRPRKVKRDTEGEAEADKEEGVDAKVGAETVASLDEQDVKNNEGARAEGDASALDATEQGTAPDTAEITSTAVENVKSPSRSPTPDQVLFDAFNEKEDKDPDFVPPATPPPRRRGPARGRKSAALATPPASPAGLEAVAKAKSPVYAPMSSNKRQRTSPVRITSGAKQTISIGGATTIIETAHGYVFASRPRQAVRPRRSNGAQHPSFTRSSTRHADRHRSTPMRADTSSATNELRPLRARASGLDQIVDTPTRRTGLRRSVPTSDKAASSRGEVIVAGDADSDQDMGTPSAVSMDGEVDESEGAGKEEDGDEWGFLRSV